VGLPDTTVRFSAARLAALGRKRTPRPSKLLNRAGFPGDFNLREDGVYGNSKAMRPKVNSWADLGVGHAATLEPQISDQMGLDLTCRPTSLTRIALPYAMTILPMSFQ
jgi:hypothetical protein